jgi:hypothetical protein
MFNPLKGLGEINELRKQAMQLQAALKQIIINETKGRAEVELSADMKIHSVKILILFYFLFVIVGLLLIPVLTEVVNKYTHATEMGTLIDNFIAFLIVLFFYVPIGIYFLNGLRKKVPQN